MIDCTGLVKIYRATGVEVFALQGLDVTVDRGEMLAIIGKSGSGKSTLMHVLGGIDAPSAGQAQVGEWDLTKLTARQRDTYRRQVTGFVWQNPALNLVPYLSALDNVLHAMSIAGRLAVARAGELLDLVGVAHRRHARPVELSGGEQQRVAVAVALANPPALLLADEPTGSLDQASGALVLDVLRQVNRDLGTTVVMVTHDLGVAAQVPRFIRIQDGKVATEATGGRDEVVVLDSLGRLQLPGELLTEAGIGGRVEVTRRGEEIVIRRVDSGGTTR